MRRQQPLAWVARYWWALAIVGAALVTYGVITHSRAFEYGGPISLGTILVLMSFLGWTRRRAQVRSRERIPATGLEPDRTPEKQL